MGLPALLRKGEELLLQPFELGKVPGIGHHHFDGAVETEHRGAGDQNLLVEPQDGSHRVDPLPALQHLGRDGAAVELALGLDVGDTPAQYVLRTDAGSAGVGRVDEKHLALPVGDVDAVVEVFTDLPEIQAVGAQLRHQPEELVGLMLCHAGGEERLHLRLQPAARGAVVHTGTSLPCCCCYYITQPREYRQKVALPGNNQC